MRFLANSHFGPQTVGGQLKTVGQVRLGASAQHGTLEYILDAVGCVNLRQVGPVGLGDACRLLGNVLQLVHNGIKRGLLGIRC